MAAVFFSGQATTFGALAPGLCFAFERAGRAQVGIKLRDETGGGDFCAVLWAEGGDGPALLPQAPPADCPVLALPEAMFQPAVDPAQIQTEGTGQREAGQLLLAEERWLLVVGDGAGTALIDLKAGTRIREARDAIRIRFRAWRLVQKGLGDEYDTICRHVVKRQSTVGFARG
ncbi:MAG TPA: hypothetical protein VLV76_05930 [Candidatus Acidoferrum sp.]|nr:hypothetical protein [Candidatus Acidoferrum sp.]